MKMLYNRIMKRVLKILAIVIGIAVVIYLIINARHFLNFRLVRGMERLITSYGVWAPLAVVALIILSTIIPPLPIPVPLIEIASGVIFGFWEGFALVWIAQIISSLIAYASTHIIGRRFLKGFMENKLFAPYKHYIHHGGPWAVFIARVTMAAPFNIVSFLAGIMAMDLKKFTIATTLGTLSEALLYPFIGSILRHTRLGLWRIFILVVLLSVIGPVITYIMMKNLDTKKASKG
jgi:uncharacterized membrane protein YdjX (TVP38/TMEM64 family)